MAAIAIRPYQASDLPAMLDVRHSAITRICSRDYTHAQTTAWVNNSNDVATQGVRFEKSQAWVACTDNSLVGYTNLGEKGYIDCLYVHADYQRRGVATALIAALEKAAARDRLSRLHSEVSITARPSFERQGFAVVTPQIVTSNGQQYDNFKMEKWLTAPTLRVARPTDDIDALLRFYAQ